MSNLYKKCSKCAEIKPIDQFSKTKYYSDGYSYHCKECRSVLQTKYRNTKPLNNLYRSIYERCYKAADYGNELAYNRYQGRGIAMSDEFLNDRDAFVEYIEPIYDEARQKYGPDVKLVIDRIDNNGDYERGNLRFVTPLESGVNREDVQHYEHNGYYLPLTWWARIFGVPERLAQTRVRNGWSFPQAVVTPADPKYDMTTDREFGEDDNEISKIDGEYYLNGNLITLIELSQMYSVHPSTVRGRINEGWSLEQALKMRVKS